MNPQTFSQLLQLATQIFDEKQEGANSAERVGGFMIALVRSIMMPYDGSRTYVTGQYMVFGDGFYRVLATTNTGETPLNAPAKYRLLSPTLLALVTADTAVSRNATFRSLINAANESTISALAEKLSDPAYMALFGATLEKLIEVSSDEEKDAFFLDLAQNLSDETKTELTGAINRADASKAGTMLLVDSDQEAHYTARNRVFTASQVSALATLLNLTSIASANDRDAALLKLVQSASANTIQALCTKLSELGCAGSGTGGGTGGTYTVLDDPRCYNLPILTILEDSIATAQIQIGAVTWERTDFVRPDINWFDKDSPFNQPGFYMNTKGELTANQAYVLSHRIPVTPLTTWTPNVPGQYVTYFNRAGKSIGGEDHARENPTFTTPAGVAFMRMTIPAGVVNQFQVTPGAANLDWQPFKRLFLGETPQQAQIASTARRAAGDLANFIVPGENLFRKNDSRNQPGAFIDNKGKVKGDASYQISHPIPVTSGQRYHPSSKQYVAFFSARDLPVGNGADYLRDDDAFTVPAGVAYILCTVPADEINTFRLIKGNVDKPEASALPVFQGVTPQGTQALTTAQILQSALSRQTGDLATLITPATNLFHKDDARNEEGFYIDDDGVLHENANYLVSHPIPVTAGQPIYASDKQFVAFFDALDRPLKGAAVGRDDLHFTTLPDTVYIRCTVFLDELNTFHVNEGTTPAPASEPIFNGTTPQGTTALQTAQVAQATAADLDRYLIRLPNLYNKDAPHIEGSFMWENGTLEALPGYVVGPFERVKPGTVYTATSKQFVTFFNENKQWVGGVRFDREELQFETTADTAYIRPSLPVAQKDTYQIVEGSVVPTSYSPYGRRTAANLVVSSRAADKIILVGGTSIPAGSGYWEQACAELGARCIMVAVPSSPVRILNSDGTRNGMHWENCAYALTHTVAQKNDLLANWASYRLDFVNADVAPTSFTAEQAEFIRNCSFERRIIPYIDGSNPEVPGVDLIVFSHGYNDVLAGESEASYLTIPADPFDRSYFLGAANFLFREILKYNPLQKIVIEGHFENQQPGVARVALGQQKLADYWQYPLWRLWQQTGWSQRRMPNTAARWAQMPWAQFAADAESREAGSTSQDMTALRFSLPDNVHPYSDPTGKARQTMARLIRNHLNETF
ncbi:hypothetical protein GGR92_004797 [Spirosoma lacussanchae]|uniref:hypothetical protein n=1 Tax=Spirosoma lacussanchae TaxID=1884249 RepID=UPI0011089202|nr:hypothetical protein [Spirosoma lacussanchae]